MKAPTKKPPSLSSVRKALREIVLPRWKLVVLGLVLISVSRLCALVLPYSTRVLIDDVIGTQSFSLWTLLGLVGAAILLQAASSFALTLLLSVEAHRLIAQLRVRVQRHVLRLPTSYFDNTKTGALVSRIMNDVEGVRNLVGTGLVQLVGGLLQSIVAFAILVNLNATLTFATALPLATFGFVSMKAFAYIRPIFRERSVIHADVTGRLTESLGGIRVIKGFHAESREEEVFREGTERIFRNVRKSLTATSLVTTLSVALMGVTSVLIMGFGARSVAAGEMSVGDLFAFTLILGFLISPILQMANIGTQMTEAFAGLDRMEELLSVARETDDDRRTHELAEVAGDLVFEDVSFSYEDGPTVLSAVSFRAPPGSVTALVGTSGSGKTTIAGLAASFLTPQEGTVRVDGVDLATVKLESYRARLGLVLQDDFLFEGSIRENILFARPNASEEALQDAVDSAHVQVFTEQFENGLETIIGERGVKLSGGQRQRVAIARALLANPRVLILDEATSNLDTESEAYIQDSLKTLMHGRTTLVIAHRLSTIREADQIFVIEEGEIVERGKHDELIKTQGRYHKLYTYQARI
jgi:ABC-type multidrug transport system fused ATPase/permease subunit